MIFGDSKNQRRKPGEPESEYGKKQNKTGKARQPKIHPTLRPQEQSEENSVLGCVCLSNLLFWGHLDLVTSSLKCPKTFHH